MKVNTIGEYQLRSSYLEKGIKLYVFMLLHDRQILRFYVFF